ncbi:glycosyltransferase family 2 protein [Candidatus Woesearchaeota archaeon]|nr:glycosyltransferase family 2 protein [Candidatus Woesearchaeota archaeon]
MKLWMIVPAYNEAQRVGPVLEKLKAYSNNLVLVDDGSKDETSAAGKAAGVTVLRHVINMGKGAALKTGADYALAHGADTLIFIDADGQHPPEDIPKFLAMLDAGRDGKGCDIVFGQRGRNSKMPAVFRFGNWFIDQTVALLYGIRINDTQCGYRAMTAEAYKRIRWTSTSYAVESEMIANAGHAWLRYAEVPIPTVYADRYKGTTVLDGVKIVLNLLWWRISKSSPPV